MRSERRGDMFTTRIAFSALQVSSGIWFSFDVYIIFVVTEVAVCFHSKTM